MYIESTFDILRHRLPCIFCIQCCNWLDMLCVAVLAVLTSKLGKWSTWSSEAVHFSRTVGTKGKRHQYLCQVHAIVTKCTVILIEWSLRLKFCSFPKECKAAIKLWQIDPRIVHQNAEKIISYSTVDVATYYIRWYSNHQQQAGSK